MACGIWSLVTKALLAVPIQSCGKLIKPHLTEKPTKIRIMGKQQSQILRLLKSASYELNTAEIAEHFKKDVDTIGRALRGLRDAGVIANGETEYVNGKARLTWKLVNQDVQLAKEEPIEKPDVMSALNQMVYPELAKELQKSSVWQDKEVIESLKQLLTIVLTKL